MDARRAQELAQRLVGERVGGWRVKAYISHGNTAIVLRAQKRELIGALKIFDPELRDSLSLEVQIGRIERQLSLRDKTHPHLVEILDGGRCNTTGSLFIVMGLIEGNNLRDLLEEVPRENIAFIISQVASAAQFLEDIGIVHRDIKPSNVAVTPDFKHAVLLDLGVIRPVGPSDLTDSSSAHPFVGTLRYSPPEFLKRREQETLDDWRALTFYQLGAVLHDLIMRRPLFADATSLNLGEAILRQVPDIPNLAESSHLVSLARNCLVKSPALRLQLVSWPDFYVTESTDNKVEDIKKRIRSREIIAAQAKVYSSVDVDSESRMLASITESIAERIRAECIKSGLFPPLELKSYGDLPARSIIHVSFAPSQRFSLEFPTSLVLLVELAGAEESVVQILWAAFLGEIDITGALSSRDELKSLYDGIFDLELVTPKLEELLYRVLDKAQEVSVALGSRGETGIIRLILAT